MKTTFRIALMAALLPLGICAEPPGDPPSEELSIRFQQGVDVAGSGYRLHFSGYHDARCPVDVRCVHGGSAIAFFWLTGPDIEPRVLSLPLGGTFHQGREVRVGRHTFVLHSLEPRSKLNAPAAPSAYHALVVVGPGSSGDEP